MAGKTDTTDTDPLALTEALARAHHKMALYDAEIHRLAGSDLTGPQARGIFCLGETDGLTCSEITDRTLITKGTLTGVLDRLEAKGLVQRWGDAADGRRVIVDLTRTGKRIYRREHPRYAKAMAERLAAIGERERKQAIRLLDKIAAAF